MLAEQLAEFRDAALFVRAEMEMNLPAQIILAEIKVVGRVIADDDFERLHPETLRLAQQPAQL